MDIKSKEEKQMPSMSEVFAQLEKAMAKTILQIEKNMITLKELSGAFNEVVESNKLKDGKKEEGEA